MATEWDIEERRRHCRLCGRAFAAGEEVHSAVFPRIARELTTAFARRDYCVSCYGRHAFAPFSSWRSTAPEAAERRVITTARVLGFFEKVANSESVDHRRTAYLLSLWLLRKRALVLRGIETTASEDGRPRESLKLEDGEGRTFRVEDPGIQTAAVEALEAELRDLLTLPEEPATSGT